MRRLGILTILLIISATALFALSLTPEEVIYLSPLPGSDFHNPEATIILKMDETQIHQLSSVQVSATGSESGEHNGEMKIYENTLIFKPATPFAPGEKVSINVDGLSLPLAFDFFIKPQSAIHERLDMPAASAALTKPTTAGNSGVRLVKDVAVPADFPRIETIEHGETGPGRIFFASTFLDNEGTGNYIVICENDGTPYYYRKVPRSNLGTGEFKVQDNGMLSFYQYLNGDDGFYITMNNEFADVDTFRAGDGYRTDSHEMLLLENGHALLVVEEDRNMDLSSFGGSSNATVIGNHMMEIDADGNVYWFWRCWDHLDVADTYNSLTQNRIDYVHLNSIAIDYDGNYIVSLKHLFEVCKIDPETGDFIWRFGGKNNQFDIDDEYHISDQHHAQPVQGKPNWYTIYDNGTRRNPQFTRGVEYKIDPAAMTAEKVWQYRYDKKNHASMMGSVQRLSNGNTFIDWSTWPPLIACEVDADNNLVFEMQVHGVSSYRTRRYEWDGNMPRPYLLAENNYSGATLIFNKFGDTEVSAYIIYGGVDPNQLVPVDTTEHTFAELGNLPNNTTYHFSVRALYADGSTSAPSETAELYIFYSNPGEEMIANSDFANGTESWDFIARNGAQANGTVIDGEFHVEIEPGNGGDNIYDIQLVQESFPLVQGRKYIFEFDAWADNNRVFEPRVAENGGDWTAYSKTTSTQATRRKKHFEYEFEMTDPTDTQARLVMNCGASDINIYFDNISVRELFPANVENENETPTDFALHPNVPNPFNPSTTLSYSLQQQGHVHLSIYNMLGQQIRTLMDATQQSGAYTIRWDGTDDKGQQVAGGVYLYRLQTENGSLTRKMVLMR